MLFIHSKEAGDPYLRAAFGVSHRLRRLAWNMTWLILGRMSPTVFHGWRSFLLRLFGAKLGKKNLIYPKAKVWAPWMLETGELVTIANDVELYNPGGVTIEGRAILSQGSFLCGGTHDYNSPDFPMTWKPIRVGPYAWICARAIVLPGVAIGEGAVLGAGSVTSRDLEPWGVYAGNPARKVGRRSSASG